MTAKHLCPALLATLLAGCSGLRSNEPNNQLYVLQPQLPAAAVGTLEAGMTPAGPLLVMAPMVAPGLDNERIALVHSDGRLDFYAASQWPEKLSRILQPLVVDALRAAGRFSAVHDTGTPFNAEYQLQMEVRHFEVQEGAKPTARISMVVMLGRRADRTPLSSFTIDASSDASENRMTAIIEAFNEALSTALAKLAEGAVVKPPAPATAASG